MCMRPPCVRARLGFRSHLANRLIPKRVLMETVQITMPQMGESVSEGTVLTWHKKEGDWIDKGETVVEVSTEKIDAEVPAPASGKLAKIVAQEDETVAVGDVLGEIEASQEGPGG